MFIRCLSVGTNLGFKIFGVSPLDLLYSCGIHKIENCAVGIVEMLYTNNILAITGINESSTFSPKRLTIWNTTSSISLCEISFNSPIIFVRMNKLRIVVVNVDKIHIYDTSTIKFIGSIPASLCILGIINK